MKNYHPWIKVIFALCAFSVTVLVQAQDWQVSGTNTLRAENYQNEGDASKSPYLNEGGQYYDEFNLNVAREVSPYERWRGVLYGVVNDSDYRHADNGFVPERVNISIEKGDSNIPFRAEAGDYFAYTSYRTLQRSLKGIQLEFQPKTKSNYRRHSLLFISGASQPAWLHFDSGEDYTNALSWLVEDQRYGRLSLNYQHNSRDSDGALNLLAREQDVFSLAGETMRNVGGHRINLEGELGLFSGDHNGTTNSPTGQNTHGNGFFVQLQGDNKATLKYRLRTERYDQDYQPNGALVTSDRKSNEAHLGWRSSFGLQSRVRIQQYQDGVDSLNPRDTHVIGVNFSGPLFRKLFAGSSGRLNIFQQAQSDKSKTIDQDTKTLEFNANKVIANRWNTHLSLFVQDVADNLVSTNDVETKELELGVDHGLTIKNFKGIISPGIAFRRIDSTNNDSSEWSPTLGLNLSKDAHSIAFNYGWNRQDRSVTNTVDMKTITTAVSYRYQKGSDSFGIEANRTDIAVDPGQDTTADKISIFWSHRFDRSFKSKSGATQIVSSALVQKSSKFGISKLLMLRPGSRFDTIKKVIADQGMGDPIVMGKAEIYETVILQTIEQRQRLALQHKGGRLTKSSLIIDFEDSGRPESMMQTFEKVRKLLLDTYGNPVQSIEEGVFDKDFMNSVNKERLIRIMEWDTGEGIIRFGIPRRLDGTVRMEIQYANQFQSYRDTLWSLEEVR